jgi:hypothetical protein
MRINKHVVYVHGARSSCMRMRGRACKRNNCKQGEHTIFS